MAPLSPASIETPTERLRARAHALIPGGCHTYAKGDDQYPDNAPAFIVRGLGAHVWGDDGRKFIEYGAGLRSVTLGHCRAEVNAAVAESLSLGTNFVRPHTLEVEYAEALLQYAPVDCMVKFAKNGSDVTTAAVKLARAVTGRDHIAICADHPFFSTDDWFIGVTAMRRGIPQVVQDLTLRFPYADLAALEKLFQSHPKKIACVMMEAATLVDPPVGYLSAVKELCHRHGALFILDEIITGFRWHFQGAHHVYGIEPDLYTLGKGIANGFPLAALVGKSEYMRLGGIHHDEQRVFLLSTTAGAETTALAAAQAVLRIYEQEPICEILHERGELLRDGANAVAREKGLADYFQVIGRPCNLVFVAKDPQQERSQYFRALFMQELVRHGVLAPSFVVNAAHTTTDIERTIAATSAALDIYAQALTDGVDKFLQGPPTKVVFREYN